jgi:hypothetical protein
MTNFGSRLHAHANFVRAVQGVQRRSPDATSSATNAVPTVEGGAPVASIPHSTKTLIAVIAILAAIILGMWTEPGTPPREAVINEVYQEL